MDLLRTRGGTAHDRDRGGVRAPQRLAEAAARVPPGAAGDVRGRGDPGAHHRRHRLRGLRHGRAGAAAAQAALRRRVLRRPRRSTPGHPAPTPAATGGAPTPASSSGVLRARRTRDNCGRVPGAAQPCVAYHQGAHRRVTEHDWKKNHETDDRKKRIPDNGYIICVLTKFSLFLCIISTEIICL
uniref:Uncharacterized protein n=1 Tax=Arundo donax TaxID=35708 RepID=A0A0A9DJP3_ARUDO